MLVEEVEVCVSAWVFVVKWDVEIEEEDDAEVDVDLGIV